MIADCDQFDWRRLPGRLQSRRMKALATVLVLVALGCDGGDNEDAGDPQALAECLDGCDADRGVCEQDCDTQDQIICQDTCSNLSNNCSVGFCDSFTPGTPRRLVCENACNRYEGDCIETCPQVDGCLDDCDTALTSCVTADCQQFAVDTDERASCVETCVDTAGVCVGSCAVDDSCDTDCAETFDFCDQSCQADFG